MLDRSPSPGTTACVAHGAAATGWALDEAPSVRLPSSVEASEASPSVVVVSSVESSDPITASDQMPTPHVAGFEGGSSASSLLGRARTSRTVSSFAIAGDMAVTAVQSLRQPVQCLHSQPPRSSSGATPPCGWRLRTSPEAQAKLRLLARWLPMYQRPSVPEYSHKGAPRFAQRGWPLRVRLGSSVYSPAHSRQTLGGSTTSTQGSASVSFGGCGSHSSAWYGGRAFASHALRQRSQQRMRQKQTEHRQAKHTAHRTSQCCASQSPCLPTIAAHGQAVIQKPRHGQVARR
mmetsp:Transcript_97745/g.276617  ORF Transcript_97745/g.276617 Transcript_97745/m.276617 type:complete len:290 (-) Transcript_97745:74-943(-)